MVTGSSLSVSHCLNPDAMRGIGSYLAQVHNSNKTFFAKYPDQSFVEGKEPSHPSVPKDSLHYGVCHGDFHCGNYLLRTEESKEKDNLSNFKVAAFDFEELEKGWFVQDFRRVIWDLTRILNDHCPKGESLFP